MKQIILYLVASIFLLASCQQEERVAEETATGYLSIEGIALQADVQTVSSRAVDADLYVEILLQDGARYSLYEPGQVPDKIELPVGTYQLRAYNEASLMENHPYEGLGYAVYSSEAQSFNVEAEAVTPIELEVPMTNFGVTLQLPEEFATYFGDNYTFTVTSDRPVELREGETAYFPYSENVTFSYSLKVVNADGEESTPEGGTRTEVASGTLYTVTYVMETQSLSVAQ